MAKRFVKEVLKPGTYQKHGRKIQVTDADVRAYADGVKAVHATGLDVPLIWEHSAHGDSRGLPMSLAPESWDQKADQTRNTAGRVVPGSERNKLNERGGLDLEFEVFGEEDAAKIAEQRIRFVSPYLLRNWRDGKGVDHGQVIGHVALTHRPVQLDQVPDFTPLSECFPVGLSLSMDEGLSETDAEQVEPIALADEPKEDPDMPPKVTTSNLLTKVIEHLSHQGLRLPSDTNDSNFMERLLTSLMTKAELDARKEAEESQEKQEEPIEEGKPNYYQFAQSDEGRQCFRRITKLTDDGHITPALRDTLLCALPDVQLSEDSKQLPCFALEDLLGWIESGSLPGKSLFRSVEQLSQGEFEVTHPDPGHYTKHTSGVLMPGEKRAEDRWEAYKKAHGIKE